MQYTNYSNKHKETYKHIENTNTCIVFIHGFTESPSFFKFLNKIAIKKGYSYLNILLPGHGSSSLDFCKNGYKQWVDYVDKRINDMEKIYENIVLVGHSMGCLLSINAYLSKKHNIKGIFCLNIPIDIRMNFSTFLASIKIVFRPNNLNDEFAKFMLNRSSISERKLYLYPLWVFRYIDLFYLSFKIYKNIKNINIPIVYVQSYKDGLVSIDSAFTLRRLIKKYKVKNQTVFVLKSSNHYEYINKDFKVVINAFKTFLNTYAKNSITINN